MFMAQSENRLLNSLPQNVFAALEPHLNTVNVKFGEVVAETEQPITRVYFPHHCVISLVVEMEVGDLIETAMVAGMAWPTRPPHSTAKSPYIGEFSRLVAMRRSSLRMPCAP